MEYKDITLHTKPLGCELAREPVHITPRHCEERLEGEEKADLVQGAVERNERRGNLPSQTSRLEILTAPTKITLLALRARRLLRGCNNFTRVDFRCISATTRNDEFIGLLYL
jgi:hypothetical protein